MKIIKNILTQENKTINKQLEALLERVGPIKKNQLNKLLGYNIDINSKNIIKFKIKKREDKNFGINFLQEEIYSYKTYNKNKILHNILLLETYLLIKNKIGGNLYNTFFDGEIRIPLNESVFEYGNLIVQPDITVYRGNTIICLEMDMGTETYEILKNKELSYKKFSKKYGDNYRILVIFSSYKKRNDKIKEYKIFEGINVNYINLDEYLPFLKY